MKTATHPVPPRPRRATVQLTGPEMQYVKELARERSSSVSSTLRSLLMLSPEFKKRTSGLPSSVRIYGLERVNGRGAEV